MKTNRLQELLDEVKKVKALTKRERKLLYYERNQIDPKFPDNAWIDPKGKVIPKIYGGHNDFAYQWLEDNRINRFLLSDLKYKTIKIDYPYQFLELLGWVRIHSSTIMVSEYTGSITKFFICTEFGFSLSASVQKKINYFLKNSNKYKIWGVENENE